MKRTKIVSIMLAAVLAATVFAGCKKKITPSSSVIIVTQQTTAQQTTVQVTVNTNPAPFINTEATSETYETVATEETTKKPTATPKPTSTPAPTPSVKIASHVKDEAGVIKDDAALEAKLAEFEKATKIIPVVYTVKTNLKGDDFRTYVKNIYKNNYKDQNHFLIVYRVSKNGGGWSWTSSIGSKAYNKLKKAGISATYSNDLSKALSGNKDKGKAFISFFNDAQQKLGK